MVVLAECCRLEERNERELLRKLASLSRKAGALVFDASQSLGGVWDIVLGRHCFLGNGGEECEIW